MNAPKTKFNFRKKNVLKKIKENPDYYKNRDNAVSTYNLVQNNYDLIEFESNSERVNFERCIDKLKNAILTEPKELFIQEFAKTTFDIASYLRKSISIHVL